MYKDLGFQTFLSVVWPNEPFSVGLLHQAMFPPLQVGGKLGDPRSEPGIVTGGACSRPQGGSHLAASFGVAAP